MPRLRRTRPAGRILLCLPVLLLAACATALPGAGALRPESVALVHPEQTKVGAMFATRLGAHAGESGFRILTAGAEGFLARAQMIDASERTVDVQYFIFRGDDTGRLLTEALVRAADRGVRVRVLVDDGDTVAGDEQLFDLAAHPSIEVRVFNPWAYRGHSGFRRAVEFMLSAGRLDYRMHNKLLVADNTLALVGGRNVGNEYFQVDPAGQLADNDVFVAGPVAQRLSVSFDEFWNSRLAVPASALKTRGHAARKMAALRERARWHPAELVRAGTDGGADYVTRIATGEPYQGLVTGRLPLIWAQATVVWDSPEKRRVDAGELPGHLMARPVLQAMRDSRAELQLVTPYFVPTAEEIAMLRDLRGRNVAVRVLTNSLQSSQDLLAMAGYAGVRKGLLEAGVELHELRASPGTRAGSGQPMRLSRFGHYGLHAKLFVFDRSRVFFGSMNFDERSRHLNTELGLVVDSPALAEQTALRFDAMTRPENAYALSLRPSPSHGTPQIVWQTEEGGVSVEVWHEPGTGGWRRAEMHAVSVLPLAREL